MSKLCIACGVEFIPKRIDQNACSSKCSKKTWKILNIEKVYEWNRNYARKKAREDWVEIECKECKKLFLPPIGNKYQTKFCSDYCRSKFNSRIYKLNGKKKESDIKYRKSHSEELKLKNLEYKDRIRFSSSESKSLNRKATLERDKFICQMCGENEYKKLIVHHNTYPANIDNLITLCRSCHIRVHQYLDGEFYPTRNVGEQLVL